MVPKAARAASLRHTDPGEVRLQEALDAVADPVRRSILRTLAGEPDFSRACGTFDLPVSKATASHHFTVLRAAGLLEQVDQGPRRLNRLRRAEFDARFPGLLALVLGESEGERDQAG
ncbi:Transcriptional regulator [Frankia sp. AiPs1]|uniref:ArsR/SmtB family transcription factor n=1 Tax=Frankia sp. AiPa1 TaxID=573492 RepID=UPI00202B0AA9|nr:helix-turn-helix domain-containing protein [Frankia sp. AiPa1]MCL9759865.1 helix-turn-helix domain-containing protein [Frankia sp. AiPa1]